MSTAPKPTAEPKPPTPAERVAHKFLADCKDKAQTAARLEDEYEKARKNGQNELAQETLDRLKIVQCEAFAYEAGADAVLAEGKKVAQAEAQEEAAQKKAAEEARAKAGSREPMTVRA